MSLTRVAEVASVSYATAWRAANNDPAVSEDVARRVRDAMDRLGYVPTKRRVRRGRPGAADGNGIRTRNIALLLLRSGATVAPPILHELERLLREQDLNLLFACVEQDRPLPEAVRSGNVDGILGYGQFPDGAVTPTLRSIPAVWMMTRDDSGRDPWGDRVRSDNEAIGNLAARYLLDREHKHLAYLRIEPRNFYEQERLRGFRQTAEEAGAAVQEVRSPQQDADNHVRELAAALIEQWLHGTPRATGLFVPTDRETDVVHWQLERQGVAIGRDVELISCDNDDEILGRLHPRPMSIELNRPALAQVAVDRLLWRMQHGVDAPPVVVHVAPYLPDARTRTSWLSIAS